MAQITVQKLEPDDLQLARQLFDLLLLFQREEGIAEPPLPPDSHFLLLLARDDFHAVVAIKDGEVVGGVTGYEMLMFQQPKTELFIYDVAVHADYRRQGIGRALMAFIAELCVERGVSAYYVGAMADEPHAVRFYEATVGKREDVAWFGREFEAK